MRFARELGLLLLAVSLISGWASRSATAKVVYVNGATGLDTNTGLSWNQAMKTVTAGMGVAIANDKIWVARGTYSERVDLKSRVAMYGGFVGNESSLTERPTFPRPMRDSNASVLQGTSGNPVINALAGTGTGSRVDGFEIRGGGTYGVYASDSSLGIVNNTIRWNHGSGVCCYNGSPVVMNNLIVGNSASKGAGVYCSGGSPSIADNVICGNGAAKGGAIYLTMVASATVAGNTIASNGAGNDGAGIYLDSCSPKVSNNLIAYNTSGIYLTGTGAPLLRNNLLYNPGGYDYSGLSAGETDVSADPGVVSVEWGWLHVQPGSPCIDAGCDADVKIGWTDIDGQARIHGAHVDIGADESDNTTWFGESVVVYVSPSGDNTNDGSSWASAKKTVQEGMNTATAYGGEVWVAEGAYEERLDLRPYTRVYGGFTGTEGTRSERDWNAHVVTIDAKSQVTAVSAAATGHRTSLFDGFTVRGGNAGSSTGSGISFDGSSPTISNNTITANAGNAVLGSGPAVLTGNTITANSGTGVRLHGNSVFSHNVVSWNKGSGISIWGPALVSDNLILANDGTGIHCEQCSPRITGNAIRGNVGSALGYGYGGGIYCLSAPATISGNVITGNSARDGAGIHCDGTGSPAVITNNIISGNSATGAGGGIYTESSATITNNTVTGNYALDGGGMYLTREFPTVESNIVAHNSSGIKRYGGMPTMRNNCVHNPGAENYIWMDPGVGDISVDPKLASVEYGRLHLIPGSPCIDAGLDAAVQPGLTDIDGQARIQGAHVDIGADESDGSTWSVEPAIVRVTPTGSDANDGSSWHSAKRTVQAAIDTVSAVGGEVWVAAGTYGERTRLWPYVGLYGGFAGHEALRDSRNPAANPSILDGGAIGTVVTVKSPFGVMCTIDGFVIRNGAGTAPGSHQNYAGGIYCTGSAAVISNNLITGNKLSASYRTYGAGIYVADGSPSITNNRFLGNSTLTTGYGGAIHCESASPTISGNLVMQNAASYGGGISSDTASPVIAGNTIRGNVVTIDGGGIYSKASSVTVVNNVISANNRSGVYCSDGAGSKIVNNTITDNSGANGGGISFSPDSPITIANNIVAFNSSGLSWGTAATLRNNCVFGNTSHNYSGLSPGQGDMSVDPKLVAVEYGKVHIQPDSPCIDHGSDADVVSGWLDMDLQARVSGAHVDIGADESDGTPHSSLATVVRVSPSGNDLNDGSTWALAKRTVQRGVDAACVLGGEVWLAAGIYHECLTLHPYASLYGGFSGAEDSRDLRDWVANVSLIDGDARDSVIRVIAGYQGTCAVDGLTIRNGNATQGGGMHAKEIASPQLRNSILTGNSAGQGGGVYFSCPLPTISNCSVVGNSATTSGGAVYTYGGSPSVSGNTIDGNRCTAANSNGGGVYFDTGTPSVIANSFTGNSAVGSGGGLYLASCSGTASDNLISGNTAGNGGGGAYLSSCSVALARNTIRGNGASSGGGFSLSGGSAIVSANFVIANTATSNGGGVHCSSFNGPICSNLIASNSAILGGGIYTSGSSLSQTANNIIAFNSSGIYKYGTSSGPTLRCNDLYNPAGADYTGIIAGTGDISADPLLADLAAGNYHIPAASPGVNAGWNEAPGLPVTDIDGQPRTQCGAVDIGVDEVNDLPPPIETLTAAKTASNNAWVSLHDLVVSVPFTDHFYAELATHILGIRIDKVGHALTTGSTVACEGVMRTNSNGERYLYALTAAKTGTGLVAPVYMPNRSLGGGPFGMQQGIDGASGLSNLGLLVRTSGRCTYVDSKTFMLDDGSGVRVKVSAPPTVTVRSTWTYAAVTGASSCEVVNGVLQRVIRPRALSDIQVF